MTAFKEKRFRYGTFSTAMMLFAVVLFILINLFATEIDRSHDLTNEQLFTLTQQSHNFLAGLDQDITITHVSRTGNEHTIIAQLMEEYAAASSHITIETRDPMINPTLLQEMRIAAGVPDIPDGSVVVQSATNTRLVHPSDMMTLDFNNFGQAIGIRSFNFESEITRAIHHVSQGAPPIVYIVTGSDEFPVGNGLIRLLERENFLVREVNLVVNEVPEDADILFIPMPTRDWGEIKADRILGFLENEGRAFVALNFFPDYFPNMSRVLAAYGVSAGQYVIYETAAHSVQVPFNIIPFVSNHAIMGTLAERNFFNLLMLPTYVETLDLRRASLEIEPLMSTSREAFARTDNNEGSPNQVASDIDGPFNLAVAITDSTFVEQIQTTRLVVVGSMGIAADEVDNLIGGGNSQFVLSSLRWLQGQQQGIWIPARRPPGNAPLIISNFQATVINGIAMGALPLIILGFGIFIWFRRRHN